MSLWDWAVEAYGRDPAAWLALQDDHGQNVPLLLWAAWAGTSEAAVLDRGAAVAREWEGSVTGPLRGVRRRLEPGAVREAVKAAELAAERVLLERLEPLAPRAEGDPAAAMAAASAAWGRPAAERLFKDVAALLYPSRC